MRLCGEVVVPKERFLYNEINYGWEPQLNNASMTMEAFVSEDKTKEYPTVWKRKTMYLQYSRNPKNHIIECQKEA